MTSNTSVEMTFSAKELKRLKELYPKAKHFVYIGLPENKETSFIVENRAPYKKSVEAELGRLQKEFGYKVEDMKIEKYDLREVR